LRSGTYALPLATRACLVCLAAAALACNNSPNQPEATAKVTGIVEDAQANTRLFFYDDGLNQLGPLSIQVRADGSYGPLAFDTGTFFGAGTANGFTTGELTEFEVRSPDDSLTLNFDLDPVSVPLQVGNRWTYDEFDGGASAPARTVTVEITASQPGEDVPAIFTAEERTTDLASGAQDTTVYYLATSLGGIVKSADPTIDAADELLLRLPATLGLTWSTADFATGAALQKRIKAIVCDGGGCQETNDFTIAQEPAGTFMSVSEIHDLNGQTVITVFSDIGIVDQVVLQTSSSATVSQRKLTGFESPSGGST
jgi:hypothetical protein